MAVEAPYSKYRKQNFIIGIFVCLIAAVVFGYDGYLSKYEWSGRQDFYNEHTENGVPDSTMKFNQYSPFVFIAAAVISAVLFYIVKDKKIVAADEQLIINDSEKIPYSSIQKIDKTHFDSKGFFIITYKAAEGTKIDRTITYKAYDNLKPVLELLVSKIS